MYKWIVFLITCLSWNLWIQTDERSMHIEHVNELVNRFIVQIEQEFGLICIGNGSSMPYDVESISLKFVSHQRATIDQACALEVQIIEKFLEVVNQDANIRPYLREYPFTAPRAKISISFNKPNGEPYTDGIVVGHVFQVRGYIFYCKTSKEGNLSDLGEEPYEAALKIAQNPHLKLKHDFSKRWSKKKEVTFELCLEEETKFLKQYSSQTPFQRWERTKEIVENDSCMKLSEAIRELILGVTDPYFIHDTLKKIAEMEKIQNSGEYVEYWSNGQIKVKAAFKNKLADGHIHGWYENGYDAFKGNFCEGIKQGIHIAFFPPSRCGGPYVNDGRILIYNEQGEPHCKQLTKYPTGHLESIMRYKNGVLDGEMTIYGDMNTNLIEQRTYENGKLIHQINFPIKHLKSKSKHNKS